jgi:hypothetical protein
MQDSMNRGCRGPTVNHGNVALPVPTGAGAELGDESPVRCGWGRCARCNCQHYEGNTWQCQNCGHNYHDHW